MHTEKISADGPEEVRTEKAKAGNSIKSRFREEWPWLLSILVLNGIVFFQEIFLRRSISRMSRLAEWDSVFQNYASGAIGSCDPSLAQLLVPNYFLVAKLWHKGELPLWNPYCGTGMPLIGDIQATVFSPLHAVLAIFPDARTYNLILVGEVLLACLGAYCLARLLTLSRPASLFAAVGYAYAPYTLAYLELLSGTSHAILPFLGCSFVMAARWPSPRFLALAGLTSAGYVISGHPESSLFGVVASVVLFFIVRFSLPCSPGSIGDIILIGLPAVGLAAPVILPFAEYVAVGDSYKYGVGASAFAPWPSLLLNILNPVNGGCSPYLGCLVGPMLLFAPFVERPRRRLMLWVLAGTFLSFSVIAHLWPFSWLLLIRPFSYLVTIYLIPVFLLGMVILAGLGLDSFSEIVRKGRFWTAFGIVAAAWCVVALVMAYLYLAAIDLTICNFDQTQPAAAIDGAGAVRNLALAMLLPAFMAVIAFLRSAGRRFAAASSLVLAIVLFNGLSLVSGLRASLPVQPKFDYPRAEIIDFLLSHPGRVLSVNEHVLKPNANCVYGISSLRVHNPILPRHFCDLVKLCGANIDEFRNQTYSGGVKDFVDLLSVRYLLGQFTPLDADARYKKIFQSNEAIAVYENTQALPEAYQTSSFKLAGGDDEALSILRTSSLRRPLVIEPAPDMKNAFAEIRPSTDSAIVAPRVSRPSTREVQLETDAPYPTVCVLTDTFYPGWKAEVDGKEVPISKANLLFRALPLGAGKHLVRFSYMPLSFVWGVVLAMLSLAFLATQVCRKKKLFDH